MSIENLWQHAAEADGPENQWASVWMSPGRWPFTVTEVVERLNEWLTCLDATFRFKPDSLLSNDHYVWMKMRDHAQALAVASLGRIVAQTLLDEKKG